MYCLFYFRFARSLQTVDNPYHFQVRLCSNESFCEAECHFCNSRYLDQEWNKQNFPVNVFLNILFHISQWPHLLLKLQRSEFDRSSTGTNQKAVACQADQSRKRAACQKNSSLATFLRHCKARLMVVVLLVLPRQGLLLLSTSPLLLLFKLLFQVLCQVF